MTASTTATPARVGTLHRWRVRWFGEPDPVADQLADLARQGSGMARLAHACAFLLTILFSLGSLVALASDALAAVLASIQAGTLDIPSTISVAVSTLLVVCMDVGMLYAASMIRLLLMRRASAAEMRLHVAVLGIVAVLEASTYAYMGALYDHPASVAAWAILIARACAAPLLAVYLSMARPVPITARDILAQSELAAGKGLIRDVLTVASDPAAPLAEKAGLFGAVAIMGEDDRKRLDALLKVAGKHGSEGASDAPDTSSGDVPSTQLPARSGEPPRRPPTGPGAPSAAPSSDDAMNGTPEQAGTGPRRLAVVPARKPAKPAAVRQRDKAARALLDERRWTFARAYLSEHAGEEVTPNRLAAEMKAAKLGPIGWKGAKRLIDGWKRDQGKAAK